MWSHKEWNSNLHVWFQKGRQDTLSFFLGLLLWLTTIHFHQFINSLSTEFLLVLHWDPENYKPPSNSTSSTLICYEINSLAQGVMKFSKLVHQSMLTVRETFYFPTWMVSERRTDAEDMLSEWCVYAERKLVNNTTMV